MKILAPTLCLLASVTLAAPALSFADQAPDENVLVEVNGAAITAADLERLIVQEHRGGPLTPEESEGLVPRLLEKAIRDELILQDAFAMGMGEDPALTEPIRLAAIRKAMSLYARDQVQVPAVTEAEVQEFFRDYYHKIQIRQLSLSTPEECEDALRRIKSGETTMGTLAAQTSLDSKKPLGGLHNDIHWADLENPLRAAVGDLQPGEYSAVFPYGAVWSILRVESRTPPDQDELPKFENFIRGALRADAEEQAWASFVESRRKKVDLQRNPEVLQRIQDDEDILYRGEFKYGSEEPVLWIDDDHSISEAGFREAMSSLAMGMGDQPFAEVLEAALDDQEEFLVVWWFADREGWLEHPEVLDYYDRELERAVLETYLTENIGQKIRFNRDEYEQFYQEHQDDFRGPEQVRMSILTADDEDTIREAARRLDEGADFEFVRAEVEGRDPESVVKSRWSTVTSFSDAIVEALDGMEVGDTTEPIPYTTKWMILRLDGRREGEVPPIEEVDGAIRQALYFKEFSELLDEHLARLTAGSEIVRHEDRIRAWAERDS